MNESLRERVGRALNELSSGPRDPARLLEMLREGARDGLVNPDVLGMIEGAFAVADQQVRDIMIPRSSMIVVERDQRPEDFIDKVIESGHSRFPVIGDSPDDIEGILLAKDLLGYFAVTPRRDFVMRDVLRTASIVPESKRLDVLLREFRQGRNHMAIVVNEWGAVAGLITIEDVLECIVGQIGDEHDREEEETFSHEVAPGEFEVRALMPLEEFNQEFGTRFDESEFDTIGGAVVRKFGYLPQAGEEVTVHGVRICVLQADQRRVFSFRVAPGE